MVNTHVYQPRVATLRPPTRQPHLSNWKKKKRNLSGKCIKSYGPTKTTMSCHQYYYKTILERKDLNNQRSKEIGTTNLVSLVEKLSWMKEYGMTFQGEKEHATNHANT
ncbi:hypothetical protein G9A89_017098 [Geosiphon pyriformis]|nr:hypothetical protein G9A89_017098 [Geosiphon pyriformis]